MYNSTNHNKLKILRVLINILLANAYIITFTGCMTTYNYSEPPESIDSVSASKMIKIKLKNGEFINCADKIISFEIGSDSVKYILLTSYTLGKGNLKYRTDKRISEKDIYKIYYEASKVNSGLTGLLVIGILIVGLIVAYIIAVGTTPNAFSPY